MPVNEKMEVTDAAGKVVPNVYCIGDANGKYMLAHAASAQVRGGGQGGNVASALSLFFRVPYIQQASSVRGAHAAGSTAVCNCMMNCYCAIGRQGI